MFPGMNPRMVKQAMKKMGMTQEDIEATEVIIKTPGKELVITNPQVSKVNMMGQETFQIIGDVKEISKRSFESLSDKSDKKSASEEPEISEDDIKTVMEQANCSEKEAESAIKANKGDLAAAIMQLNK